jgi:uncharacterized protein YdhG (YjbR/CyaY superfamily)
MPERARRGKGAGTPKSGFTEEERAAMRERARELQAGVRSGSRKEPVDGESLVRAKLSEMPEPDRQFGERFHAAVKAHAPNLSPRTWYGMPAYAKDGEVLCFFRPASKFKTRYATIGFSDAANLDDGAMWPTDFALNAWTSDVEERIVALLRRAIR